MKAQSQSLQEKMSQAIDSTLSQSSQRAAGMKNSHLSKGPNCGTRSEKTTWKMNEAFFITALVLALVLTGCSGSMNSVSQAVGETPVANISGEATLPDIFGDSIEKNESANSSVNSSQSSLQSFIQEAAVSERVRLVLGWLKFVSQSAAAERVDLGWTRLNSGRTIGSLNSAPILERPDLSTYELMMWRQILLQSEGDLTTAETLKRVEEAAVILTMAMTPDDVMRVDNVLVAPETVAGY